MSPLNHESHEDDESNNKCEPSRSSTHNGYTHSAISMHNKRPDSSRKNVPELRTQRSHLNQAAIDFSDSIKKEQGMSGRDTGMVNKNSLFTVTNFLNSRDLINVILYLATNIVILSSCFFIWLLPVYISSCEL